MPEQQIVENLKNISFSKKDYLALLETYHKLGEILVLKKNKKAKSFLKTLYGIWQGIKINENDFKKAEKSLFKKNI